MKPKFGLFHPVYTYDGEGVQMIRSLTSLVSSVEGCGFDSFWLMDHLHQVERQGTLPEPVLDSWTALGALASVGSRIKLGTLVTANIFRHPSLLAKIAATVDVVSDGRLMMGLGAAWHQAEAEAYGIQFPSPAERVNRLEEAVQIIKKMWTEERTTFQGRYYRVDRAYCSPKPLQKPHPPFLIGGGGEKKTLRVVARHADACNLAGSPIEVKRKLGFLREHCEAEGRDYDSIMKTKETNIFLYRDREDAKKSVAAALQGKTQQEIDHYAAYGDPDDIVRYLEDSMESGIEYFMLFFEPRREKEALDLFVDEVMPRMA